MRTALFLAFLLAALGFAAWRGGGPERAMAAIALGLVGADRILHQYIPVEFATLDVGHLTIDLAGVSATTVLAICEHRFWTMIAPALHFLPLLAPASRMLDRDRKRGG